MVHSMYERGCHMTKEKSRVRSCEVYIASVTLL